MEYDSEKYRGHFVDRNYASDISFQKLALERAYANRDFEITLYWKRATYFWAFIAAVFVAYGVVLGIAAEEFEEKKDALVLLACLGTVLSFAWLLVNRGSKRWQENWEIHVDMLENEITGPLYKVLASKPSPKFLKKGTLKHLLVGSTGYSVSKINQIISLYMIVIWLVILSYSTWPWNFDYHYIDVPKAIILGISFMSIVTLFICGRTSKDEDEGEATATTSEEKFNLSKRTTGVGAVDNWDVDLGDT